MTFLSKKYQRLISREYLTFSFDGRTQVELDKNVEELLKSYEAELTMSKSHHLKRLTRMTNG